MSAGFPVYFPPDFRVSVVGLTVSGLSPSVQHRLQHSQQKPVSRLHAGKLTTMQNGDNQSECVVYCISSGLDHIRPYSINVFSHNTTW